MADETNPNYSGGHWGALKLDGTRITDDPSLMRGWSIWPVDLLPRYLDGAEPVKQAGVAGKSDLYSQVWRCSTFNPSRQAQGLFGYPRAFGDGKD